ncbi:MAG: GNAT family N-acetyltransferase [Deltaproteobacteria bacterium]|nr:GNAT family N-acetyltransferase [Deltaproteobacteria bacterium]
MSVASHGYPRPLILKNCCEVWLRPLDPAQDAGRVFDFFDRIPPTERWYLENDVSDPTVVRHYLLEYHPARALPIIALDEQERIVGKATLNRYHKGARGHVGKIRVVVDPAYRGQRLGTYLLLDLIQLAVDLGLEMLVLEFIRGIEDKGIRAARHLDFFEQAVLPDYARDPKGNRYDLVLMVKRLHRGWEDF